MAAYISEILIWIKCHVLNRHLYITNNHGMGDAMFDNVDYHECDHCNDVKLEFDSKAISYGSKRWYDKLLKEAIRHKRAYNMKIERRKVIVEKYINYDLLLAEGHMSGVYSKKIVVKLKKDIADETYDWKDSIRNLQGFE